MSLKCFSEAQELARMFSLHAEYIDISFHDDFTTVSAEVKNAYFSIFLPSNYYFLHLNGEPIDSTRYKSFAEMKEAIRTEAKKLIEGE